MRYNIMVEIYFFGGFAVKKLRIGLIGFGAMGKVHSFSVANLKFYYPSLPFEAEIAGVCTTNFQRSEEIARTYGFGFAAKNEDELIYNKDIDVIDICTPNIYHYETIKKAIAAGKHVFCEKPLCVSSAEADEVARLARESGLICNVVFNNRNMSAVMRAKELIDEGKLGRILSFSGEYLHNSCTDVNRPAGWKQNRDLCGGGVLFDLGSHIIDLIYMLCGEFESVYGVPQIAFPTRAGSNGDQWQTNADEAFYLTAKLKCGAIGTITASKLVHGANDDLSFAIHGEKGSIKFSLMEPNFLYFYDATEEGGDLGGSRGYKAIETVGRFPLPGGTFPAPKATTDWLRGHVGGVYSFLNAVYNGKQGSPSFSDGAHVQKIMEAAYRSAEEKREVIL